MASTTSTIQAILKTLYEGVPNAQFSKRNTVSGEIRTVDDYEGDTVEISVHTGRTVSEGYQSETAAAPAGDQPRYNTATINLTEHVGTLEISNRLMRKARTNRGAFINGLTATMDDLVDAMMDTRERVISSDGSAVLGTVSAVDPSGETITLTDKEDALKFRIDMPIEAFSQRQTGATQHTFDATASPTTSGIVSVIDLDNGIITFDLIGSSHAIVATDILCRANSREASTRYESQGLLSVVSDRDPPMEHQTGFMGLKAPYDYAGAANSSPESYWASPTYRNSGTNRSLTSRLLQRGCDACFMRSGKKPDKIFSPPGVRMEFGLGQQNIRRSVNTQQISGGTTAGLPDDLEDQDRVTYQGIPFIPGKYMEQNIVVAVCSDDVWQANWGKYGWMDQDGAILKWSPNRRVAYEALYVGYWELVARRRNSSFRIEDVTGSTF